MIQVELPDGSVAEFPDDTPPEAMKAAIAKRFPPQQSVGMDVALQGSAGLNRGLDETLNVLASPIRVPINYIADLAGYGQDRDLTDLIKGEKPQRTELIPPLQFFSHLNQVAPEDATSTAGRVAGTVGEVVGGSVAPTGAVLAAGRMAPAALKAGGGLISQAASNPGRMAAYDAIGAVGSGVGIQTARENNLGTAGEFAAGLLGGFAAPAAYSAAARTGDAMKSALRYGNEAVRAARNPEEAAINSVADQMVAANLAPDEVRGAISPQRSANLQGRGVSEADMADIVSRRLSGEAAAQIGQQYGISAGTVDRYANAYRASNPTPLNIADVAVELRGPGGAMPILRGARANFGIADDSADAAQRLYNRQTEQSGRTAEIIQQSGGRGHRLEDEVERLRGAAKTEEQDAYTTAYQHQAPVIIDDVVRNARSRAQGRSGEIGTKLNEAIDLFFTPELRSPRQSPATWLRIREAQERVRQAIADGKPYDVISKLRRRAIIAEKQDEFARPMQQAKLGQTVQDVRRFVDARQELDQMIQRSMQDHKPTPLTQVLTQFRNEVNAAARSNNSALASADRRFYGNRSAERIIEEGEHIGKSLTPRSRQVMRDFRDYTPSQQELLRVSLERRLADDALNTRNTGGAANQFSSEGFRELVRNFYPRPSRASKGAQRAAEAAIYERGQALLRNLHREAITTQTGNFITGRANSPTAPWLTDIETQMQNAHAAADLATGRVSKFVENMANRLAKKIGQQAAQQQLRILTETDPAKLLQLLNRLERAAQGSAQRKQIVHQLRELRSPQLRAAPSVASAVEVMSQP